MQEVLFCDLGKKRYKEVWEFQEQLLQSITQTKRNNKLKGSSIATKNYLLFVEHYPVYTMGKSGDISNLLINKNSIESIQAEYFHSNRGGDITFHGPGQIVVYPILDLENFFTDIHKYLRTLESIIIDVLCFYGLSGQRSEEETGVWLDAKTPFARKICAMGIRASRWVTMHGLALNVNTNLSYFDHIIPCGIRGKKVTSIEKELNQTINIDLVKYRLKRSFSKHFKCSFKLFIE